VREIVCDAIVSTKTLRNATTQQKQIPFSSAAYLTEKTIISNISKRRMSEIELSRFCMIFGGISRIGRRSGILFPVFNRLGFVRLP